MPVVVKLGGGLITDKSTLCTPRQDVIDEFAQAIADLHVSLPHMMRLVVFNDLLFANIAGGD